jgi:hypothetical protein
MRFHAVCILTFLIALPARATAQDLPEFSEVDTDDVVEVADATRASTTRVSETSAQPSVFHTPDMYAPGGANAHIHATIFADWKFERVYLAYREVGEREFTEVDFERSGETDFVAQIPGDEMQPPGIEYFIASESKGESRTHYASSDDPHRVVILDETEETREAARLARHDGNRSEFELDGELTNWGRRQTTTGDLEPISTDPLSDWMWSSTLHYRYRFLSSLYEIAFGLGVIRGHQATYTTDPQGTVVADPVPGLGSGEPGMNYGYGQVTWEFQRNFSMDAKLLLGASATGFAAGIGGVARIGRLGGTRLEFGGELFEDIGSLAFMGFYWDTLPRIPMGLTVELTNRPNPRAAPGTRLMYDVGYEFSDAVGVSARVGVPVRNAAVAQGFTGGLSVRYAF